ncbi:ATPase AAA-type core [Penicillium canariense]|uniref:ATPase AAA-type core n=1 Tax=Penicillium canariense TaxID=189055 RepID=A0A9W9HY48_9EURO|nr:ATPase AAA-type core [Penicillium canariense]KAJ5159958.1 ATPase AAA-type core [Penicillium canariense]
MDTDADRQLIGEKCEFKVYRHNTKKDGKRAVEVLSKPFEDLSLDDQDHPYALVINRYFGEKSQLEKTTLQINSGRLLKVFREVIGSYPTVPADFQDPFQLDSPFQILFHHWGDLDEQRQQTQDAQERMHLNLLFDFMNNELGQERDRIRGMIRKNQITFTAAWCIFRPGDLVYTSFMGHPWLLRCQKTAYEENVKRGPYLEVHCIFSDHNGTVAGQAKQVFKIYQKEAFGAENPAVITELPVYPREFVKGHDRLEERLIERGRRFLLLQGMSIKAYDGPAKYLKEPYHRIYDPFMADWPGVWLPYTELGRVIVDRKTYQEEQIANGVNVQVQETDPLLCPPYQYGFSIARKEWARFLVDCLTEVRWEKDVWDSLIVGGRPKLVLQSLVTSHAYPEDARDQMRQKGKGLVVLLYGTPGSGKTLTAETAAEGTQKALIMTSLGELNKEDSTWAFEARLRLILRYATIWKAVVLMDEADVFLEARDDHGDNNTRNALVAVFLKELEYFSGVVFLTTNRIRSFDRAMKSRIHLALEYSPPGIETRQQIWQQILSTIPPKDTDVDLDDAIDHFVAVKLNGREISNTINTARTIARFENKPLQLNHIELVLGVRREFEDSLKKAAKKSGQSADGVGPLIDRTNSIIEEEEDGFKS